MSKITAGQLLGLRTRSWNFNRMISKYYSYSDIVFLEVQCVTIASDLAYIGTNLGIYSAHIGL